MVSTSPSSGESVKDEVLKEFKKAGSGLTKSFSLIYSAAKSKIENGIEYAANQANQYQRPESILPPIRPITPTDTDKSVGEAIAIVLAVVTMADGEAENDELDSAYLTMQQYKETKALGIENSTKIFADTLYKLEEANKKGRPELNSVIAYKTDELRTLVPASAAHRVYDVAENMSTKNSGGKASLQERGVLSKIRKSLNIT